MSENGQMGRCRREIAAAFEGTGLTASKEVWLFADAIDRLAADVAEIKAKVDDIAPGDTGRFVPSELEWSELVDRKTAAIRERDEARAEVERLNAELAARPAANYPEISDSSPAASQPAAPAAGWLTQKELRVLADHAQALREQRFALERGGLSSGYSMNPGDLKHQADAINAIIARAGLPPVVEVPAMVFGGGSYQMEKRYRAAMDRAGVQWKEVGRE